MECAGSVAIGIRTEGEGSTLRLERSAVRGFKTALSTRDGGALGASELTLTRTWTPGQEYNSSGVSVGSRGRIELEEGEIRIEAFGVALNCFDGACADLRGC